MLDDEITSVSPRIKEGKMDALTVRYPYKSSVAEFTNYDPEWPYGRPDMDVFGATLDLGCPRQRFKRLSTASVDILLLPTPDGQPTESSASSAPDIQALNRLSLAEVDDIYLIQYEAFFGQIQLWMSSGEGEQVQRARKANAASIQPSGK